MKRVGILALQGCVDPHKPHIQALGGEAVEVKSAEQLKQVDGLILPGGESTTMLKLIGYDRLWEPLKVFMTKKPTWGICAGAILMAKEVTHPQQESFAIMDVKIRRNGYGRQLQSHYHLLDGYEVAFIRAPIVEEIFSPMDAIVEVEGHPVWFFKGNKMISTFHPELNHKFPSPMHAKFLELF